MSETNGSPGKKTSKKAIEIFKKQKKTINIVIAGHVDSGKSTLTGHLLKQLKLVTKKQMRKIQKEALL